MEGGVLHQTTPHLLHEHSALSSKFRPPPDYNVFDWLVGKLNKLNKARKRQKNRENRNWIKMKKKFQKVVESSVFKFLMFLVVVLHAILLCFYQPEVMGDLQPINDVISYVVIAVLLIYFVEAVLNMIAYGLLLTPNTSYLRRPVFILDITVILFGILYLSLRSTIPVVAEICSSLMTLKLIRILTISKSVRFMLKALAKSVQPLFYLSILTFLCMLFFALVGIELFQGSLHGGCYADYISPAGQNRSVLVSNFPCNLNDNSSAIVGDHTCPEHSECGPWEDGPFHGVTSFDDIFRSLILVFQTITLEGWSGVFFLYESSLGYAYAWVYFFVVILLGSVLILNLWTGVLTIVFVDVSEREQEHGNTRRLIEEKRIDKDMEQYNEWLRRGAELQHPSDTWSIDRAHAPYPGYGEQAPLDMEYYEQDTAEEEEGRHDDSRAKERRGCYYTSSKKVEKLVRSKVVFWGDIWLHIANLGLLMSLNFPSGPNFDSTIYIVNYVFSFLFVLHLVVRVYGIGPVRYFTKHRDSFKIGSKVLELLMAVLSFVALVVFIPIKPLRDFELPVLLNAVWSIKIVFIGKISAKNWEHVAEVLKTLGNLTKVILSLMALIGLFLFLFTIAGLRIFGNRLSVTGFVQPNFDDILNSFYLVFQLLTTEDWHNVLYSSVSAFIVQTGSYGIITSLYFIAAIIVGAFILVNAFLALSVDKLSEIRDLEEDESKEKESEEKARKQRQEQLSDIKNPKATIRRRTIRRMLRFHKENPVERARTVAGGRSRWWKQLSLPIFASERGPKFLDLELNRSDTSPRRKSSFLSGTGHAPPRRSVSSPSYPVTEMSFIPEEEGSRRSRESKTIPNPLSLMDQTPTPSIFGGRGISHENSAPTATFTRLARMQAKQSPPPTIPEEREDAEDVGGGSEFYHYGLRQTSIASSPPDPVTTPTGGEVLGHVPRSHSLPVGSDPGPFYNSQVVFHSIPEMSSDVESESIHSPTSPSFATPTPRTESADSGSSKRPKRISRQDSIHDVEEVIARVSSETLPSSPPTTPPASSSRPPPTTSSGVPLSPPPNHEDDVMDLTLRYTRGSSLEPITRQAITRTLKERPNKKSTVEKLSEKFDIAVNWMREYFGSFSFDPSKELQNIPPHSAFFIIDHNNSFRKLCFKIAKSPPFRTVSYSMIILSSLVLMLEVPNGVRQEEFIEYCAVQRILLWVDVALLGFFLFEMLLKMIALGVFVHRDSFLRGFFNLLDTIVTILTIVPVVYFLVEIENQERDICISYGYDTKALPAGVGILRVFRVLRPLRAIRIGGLYLAVTGLFSSFKAMGPIFFLDGLIVIIFAVIGVHFFKGAFFFCTDPMIEIENECVGYFFKYDYTFGLNLSVPGLACPIAEQRVWTQHGLNFDHVGNATLTLFTMLTAEGWQNVMYSGINSRQPNDSRTPLASILENNRPAAFYFIIYMIVMTFILLQLFVGFVIVTFQEVGVKAFRETKLNRNQRDCLHYALTKRPKQQWIPKYGFQQKLREKLLPFMDSFLFKVVVVVVLVFNIIILCCQTYTSSMDFKTVIYSINAVCTAFFAVEAVSKCVILTPPIYFRDIWNTFSFLIALGSVIELIAQRSVSGLHIVSTLRVLRLLEFIPRVKRILWTVVKSLEIFPWVGYLLVIIIYIYSVIGMHVFGTVEQATVDESEESGVHEYNNFATFPNAVLLMLRVITGENWQDVMLNCLGGHNCYNCTGLARENSTCGSDFAYIFFPTFYFLSTIMILSLFVAIIMDNFEYIVWDRSRLGAYDLRLFVKQWAKYDHHRRGKLKPEKVFDLLRKIDPPVGWGKLCPRVTAYKKMMRLNIPVRQVPVDGVEVKMVTFNATLFALVRTTLGIDCKGCADCKKKCNIELRGKLIALFPNMSQSRFDEVLAKETDETVADEYAALLVQAEWRGFTLRRRRIVDIFQGSERQLLVHREIQDPGPDLIKARPLSTFNHDLEILQISSNTRKASETSRSSSFGGTSSPRRSTSFSPISPMPLLEPSGLEFLLEEPTPMFEFRRLHPPDSPFATVPGRPRPLLPSNEESPRVAKKSDDDDDDSSFTSALSNPSPSPAPSQESLHRQHETAV